MSFVVCIPAFNPDERMVELVTRLRALEGGLEILIVDDGSSEASWPLFDICKSYGCEIVRHEKNKGKGEALKTIASEIKKKHSEAFGYVTADCDLQHSPEDIIKTARALSENPGSLILGARDFSSAGVPFKSRLGNRATSFIFLLKSGRWLKDTQTGLRGIPGVFAPTLAQIPGGRFEYEMNALLRASTDGLEFHEAPIQTVYLEGNKSTSFHAVRDSVSIYWNIIKYGSYSFFSSIVDIGLFLFILANFEVNSKIGLFAVMALTRAVSSSLGFYINRPWHKIGRGALKAFILFFPATLLPAALASAFKDLPIPISILKAALDLAFFWAAFALRKKPAP